MQICYTNYFKFLINDKNISLCVFPPVQIRGNSLVGFNNFDGFFFNHFLSKNPQFVSLFATGSPPPEKLPAQPVWRMEVARGEDGESVVQVSDVRLPSD